MTGAMTAAPLSERFLPAADRGAVLDARMHADLAASLAHLAGATRPVDPPLAVRLSAVAQAIRAGRRLPAMGFRAYFRIAAALLAQDRAAAAAHLAGMEALAPRATGLCVTRFGDPEADRLSLELIADGMRLAPIDAEEARAFARLLEEGFALMRQGLPELHAELSGIVHEVLLARAPQGDAMEFDGASHYQFWGLLVLNPRHHRTPLAVVEVLAHEASHALLFGLTVDEPLVLNPDEELFASPLRPDPRPMDGIYHATYVSARMCWAMEALAASGILDAADRRRALAAARKDRENHAAGQAVLDAHGRPSATGRRIIEAARAWMSDGVPA